jgi:hypothetical protein
MNEKLPPQGIVCLALTPYRVCIPVDRQLEVTYTYVLEKTS